MVEFGEMNLNLHKNQNLKFKHFGKSLFQVHGVFRTKSVATLNLHLPLPVHMKHISTFSRCYLQECTMSQS